MSTVRFDWLSSGPGPRPEWSLALFAHNEASRVRAALQAIGRAAAANNVEILVLANGCTDRTADEVRASAETTPWLGLAEIERADKASAWNLYVHNLVTAARARETTVHFFVDADVVLRSFALDRLAQALHQVPDAVAAGGMPATGRDRDAWRARMVASGTLAGALYALRGSFVDRLRRDQIRMPAGLIGDDWFVSWLAAGLHGRPDGETAAACVFQPDAEFAFESLSPWRPRDVATYLRRQWRYALRGVQFEMLTNLAGWEAPARIPADAATLYRVAPLPSRLRWIGRHTLWRTAAVQWIRTRRSKAGTGLDSFTRA